MEKRDSNKSMIADGNHDVFNPEPKKSLSADANAIKSRTTSKRNSKQNIISDAENQDNESQPQNAANHETMDSTFTPQKEQIKEKIKPHKQDAINSQNNEISAIKETNEKTEDKIPDGYYKTRSGRVVKKPKKIVKSPRKSSKKKRR